MEPQTAVRNSMVLTLVVFPRMVSVIRRFVEEMAERLGANDDLSGRVALTVHELLENVAKYGLGEGGGADQAGVGTLRVDVREAIGGERVEHRLQITVTNRTGAGHLDRLRHTFRDMDAGGEPFAHYCNLMSAKLEAEPGGLGLARIRAEGDMNLALGLRGDEVILCATSDPFVPEHDTP